MTGGAGDELGTTPLARREHRQRRFNRLPAFIDDKLVCCPGVQLTRGGGAASRGSTGNCAPNPSEIDPMNPELMRRWSLVGHHFHCLVEIVQLSD